MKIIQSKLFIWAISIAGLVFSLINIQNPISQLASAHHMTSPPVCIPPPGRISCTIRTGSGNPAYAYCQDGETLMGGGAIFTNWNDDHPNLASQNNPDGPANGANQYWQCSQHYKFGDGTCYARCCKVVNP